MNSADEAKRKAAAKAAELVTSGMRLGLGTGSTAKHFVDFIGEKVKGGMDLLCVPTSEQTRQQALSLGIPLTTLDVTPELDLTVDGADEFDPSLRLIKGGGGALLREKIVAAASKRMIVIADRSKQVPVLGQFQLPIEVIPFGLEATRRRIHRLIAAIGMRGSTKLRLNAKGETFITDEGHYILDCPSGAIAYPDALATGLQTIPGVVEHGLFIGLAKAIIVADPNGVDIIGDLG
jgi:ribose 5-phosphate isomerase A